MSNIDEDHVRQALATPFPNGTIDSSQFTITPPGSQGLNQQTWSTQKKPLASQTWKTKMEQKYAENLDLKISKIIIQPWPSDHRSPRSPGVPPFLGPSVDPAPLLCASWWSSSPKTPGPKRWKKNHPKNRAQDLGCLHFIQMPRKICSWFFFDKLVGIHYTMQFILC